MTVVLCKTSCEQRPAANVRGERDKKVDKYTPLSPRGEPHDEKGFQRGTPGRWGLAYENLYTVDICLSAAKFKTKMSEQTDGGNLTPS